MKYFVFLLFVAVSKQQQYGDLFDELSYKPNQHVTQPSYNLKKPSNIYPLYQNEKREIYHYGQTFVIRDSGFDDKVHRCEIIAINEEYEAAQVTAYLSQLLKIQVRHVDMGILMYVLQDCDSVDDVGELYNIPFNSNTNTPFPSMTRGIYPGTKWCGFGDVAARYHDLGGYHNVDRCCRAHDLYPISVPPRGQRYNLINNAIYTKSHCICDETFYKCLTQDQSRAANVLRGLYFSSVSECISGLPEMSITQMQFVPTIRNWLK